MRTTEMIDSHPVGTDLDRELLARALDALHACAQACTACADACLAEEMVADLRRCITSDLNCADVCGVTANVLSRHTGYDSTVTRAQLQACVLACKACGDECEQHAGMHEHCRVCAEACRACEEACRELLATIA
ncbi:four-helix bundle copper-binding protein [Actinotalea ferrariae]|uniref:four-helix bundle copper-binding protein n=1 Tax=Actinotalea ferrariae TaxID=1386098 RepID=UPI001C8CC717|nr:four-helix bundle copper-binding protein [Actinotalea ferrariae]MBX9246251.1 four-helix bundle copper-binding protein [Actinotalea ferrariae]